MKKFKAISIILCFSLSSFITEAQKNGKKPQVGRSKNSSPKVSAPVAAPVLPKTNNNSSQAVARALEIAQSGQKQNAINQLFSLSRRDELESQRAYIKLQLGLLLMDLKLYQVAAFQFVDIIRMNQKYVKAAIENLATAADILGDETLLNYAISKVDIKDIPAKQKDMILYRMGEVKQKNKSYAQAAEYYSKVPPGSRYYYQAIFNKGLSELEAQQVDLAIDTFREMLSQRNRAYVTDTNRVAAQLALARAYYQKQEWEKSIDAYAKIPRDHFMWHDSIFEQSWAMLRAARFRSALSNFQTLHSAYYEDYYMPESLLLRSIVYLFICKYDEMEKVLSLFEKTYGPIRNKIGNFLKSSNDANAYYSEIETALEIKKLGESGTHKNLKLPFVVARAISEEGNVKRSLGYLKKIAEERERILNSVNLKTSPIGQYGLKILSNRSRNTKFAIGDMVKAHLLNMRLELRDLYEQAGFIRYEMINGQKETVKKRIVGNNGDKDQIDDRIDREFYVENGFEYYPFKGEYWLDEVGNYHYLGKQSCE